ncbi:preprotein translocase subunit SecE [Kibdelosporangium philippinense]|uniref:Protein translocase subunit SecE n=1 Tax=Kibdelosporangium philippinense TaxID=211113 RepID=A0ABS8ZFJ3_9PSEU|nr:preprotein translocase subunit SecE [Kibdelosporangium philippinense]MCE7005680.1 preprotein translocase subunit SecE [Kibdelosporangium philippinense]
MSEEPGKDRDEDQKPQSRPVTAAARRERRASARPAARKDAAPSAKAKPKSKPASESEAEGKKGHATPSRDGKEKRAGLFARLFRFLKEVVAELRKVIWPTRKQMITYTAVVLVFLAVMVAIISGLDLGIGKLVALIFG